MQPQGVVQQGLGRGVVEALGGPLGGGPQRTGGQLEVAAQPRVVGDNGRVRIRLPGQHAAGLPVQQGGPADGGAGGERFADHLVPEPERPAVGGQQLLGRGVLGVVEQVHGGTAEQRREQLDVQLRADDRGRAQHGTGRAELVAAGRHRFDQRHGQLGPGCLLGQLGQEQRMALGSLIQLIDPGRPHQLGRGRPVEQAEVDGRSARQGRSLSGTDRGDDHGRHAGPLREAQPVGQGPPGQVGVIDHHHHQRAAPGQADQHPDQRRIQYGRAEHAVGQDRLRGAWLPGSPQAWGGWGIQGHAEQGGEGRRVPAQQVGGGVGPEPAKQRGQRGQQGIQRHGLVELAARGQQHRVAGRGPVGLVGRAAGRCGRRRGQFPTQDGGVQGDGLR